ncbi:NitT/TauT family transport system permease protein [Palleronia aestuarii]|uniref:NitT/TauT family transport system permease protein n=1 Tax=Palleronia aestuarii TaxID=568105 RepID=A0A2W7N406_9RHOB|nr:ABC transporter permease [Palleronia aestuarii]PZX15095.1 NitT/TauT family transport system permease protein [Palleronia aestuarii]
MTETNASTVGTVMQNKKEAILSRRQKARQRGNRIMMIRLAFVVVFLAVWQIASMYLVSDFFIGMPTEIARDLWAWALSGTLFFHASITSIEALLGFLLGSAVGMAAGVLMGRAQTLAEIVDPFLMMFYSLPKVALAPMFILWFGIGIDMKIYLTATIVFFLVFLNTYAGVRSVSREQIAIMKLMGAKESHILRKVVLPSAVTWVFNGLRLSVPYALIGAIVGELIASNKGLGYLLANASGQYDTSAMFAALIAIMILALALNYAVKVVEKKAMPWKAAEDQREMSI